jgi:spore coat protein H
MKTVRGYSAILYFSIFSMFSCTGTSTSDFIDSDFDDTDSVGDNTATDTESGFDSDSKAAPQDSDGEDTAWKDLINLPIEDLPWPDEVTALPTCTSDSDGFSETIASSVSGRVRLSISAPLQPVGVNEQIEVTVYYADADERDTTADGTLVVVSEPQVDLIDVTDVTAGRAALVIRFREPGPHTLSVSFAEQDADDRSGAVEVTAYETQLPIWEMSIDESDFATIKSNPYERIKVPAVLSVNGVAFDTEVRLHGGSSRDYPKKSFRFDLGPDLMLEDTHDHIILRAEWNDKSMLRNYLGLEMFRNASWIHTPKAEMVHFRINEQYYGVMWHVERIGGDFLRVRGLNNETGSMYEADPSSICWTPGGDLTPVDSLDTYECIYDHKKGDIPYHDLIDLIENTLQLSDDDFEVAINEVLDVNEYLVYMAIMAVIQNHDHIKKNYFLYRDPDALDDRWVVFPWDLELTFGHLWSEEDGVLDEDIVTDSPLDEGICPGFCNQLMTRLYNTPKFQERFYELGEYVLSTTFNRDFIDERIDNLLCRAAPDLMVDSRKRADNSEYLSRVDEIRYFVDERRAFILGE